MGNRDMKYIGKLEMVLFLKVTQPPLDKNPLFQLDNWWSIFSTTPSQVDLALYEAPRENQDTLKAKKRPHSPKCELTHPHYQHYPIEPT
jgi:hypothetical protein